MLDISLDRRLSVPSKAVYQGMALAVLQIVE
jgi:hypothetical protein